MICKFQNFSNVIDLPSFQFRNIGFLTFVSEIQQLKKDE